MSGAEIITFILAALPMTISALEHYRDGLDVLKNYWDYDRTLSNLRRRLEMQRILYEGTLKRLLLSELPETQAGAFFEDSEYCMDIRFWKTKEIEEKLRHKLGGQYEVFMGVSKEMEAIMTKLMDKLEIDIQGKVGALLLT